MKSIVNVRACRSACLPQQSHPAHSRLNSPSGTVKKIDVKAKKVTLIHEELKNLRNAGHDHGVPRRRTTALHREAQGRRKHRVRCRAGRGQADRDAR